MICYNDYSIIPIQLGSIIPYISETTRCFFIAHFISWYTKPSTLPNPRRFQHRAAALALAHLDLATEKDPVLRSNICILQLVGGWTNPSEKYASKWESSPIFGVKIKNIWNHHLGKYMYISPKNQDPCQAFHWWSKHPKNNITGGNPFLRTYLDP